MTGRVIGLDVGDRRIGVAMSDALGMTAQPLTVVTRTASAADCEAIRRLVETHGAIRLIVGLPLSMRGDRGPQAQKVLSFVDALRQVIPVPIELIDERLTTVEGERAMRSAGASAQQRKAMIDQVAAQLILEHYLSIQRLAPPETHEP